LKLHKLKLIYTHFKDVKYDDRKNVRNLYKKFEIRINDRDYRAGDLLLLLEYDKASYSPYSGDGYF
jgi:hypothetical protein